MAIWWTLPPSPRPQRSSCALYATHIKEHSVYGAGRSLSAAACVSRSKVKRKPFIIWTFFSSHTHLCFSVDRKRKPADSKFSLSLPPPQSLHAATLLLLSARTFPSPLLCPQRDQLWTYPFLLYRGPRRVHLAAGMLFVEDPSVSGCFAIVGGGERDVGLNPTQPGRNEKERERVAEALAGRVKRGRSAQPPRREKQPNRAKTLPSP